MRTEITDNTTVIPWKYQNPTGLNDVLPESRRYWRYAEDILNKLSTRFGYRQIILPPFDPRSLYQQIYDQSKMNELIESNVENNNEKFVFRSHPRIGIIRSFNENQFYDWPPPVHVAFQSEVISKENDRYRHDYFYCLDILGIKEPTTAALVLIFLNKLADEMHLKNTIISIHSNGCRDCKPIFDSKFKSFVEPHLNQLCEECSKSPTPEKIYNCPIDAIHPWLDDAPVLLDHLCPVCHGQLAGILETCDDLGLRYDLNSRFFIDTPEAEQTVVGLATDDKIIPAIYGFHYDRLAGLLSERELGAFGLTIDLLLLSKYLEEKHLALPYDDGVQIFIAQLGTQAKQKSIGLLQQLYQAGYYAITASESCSISQQLQVAERLRARITLIIGQKEAINDHIIMRDMVSGLQDEIYLDELLPVLQRQIAII